MASVPLGAGFVWRLAAFFVEPVWVRPLPNTTSGAVLFGAGSEELGVMPDDSVADVTVVVVDDSPDVCVDSGVDESVEPLAEDVPEVDELGSPVSAHATPWPVAIATPTPKATANPPTRPT